MSLLQLARRSGTFYWRTNLAVLLGVAAAVAVLGGALLVGDSVRGSLRDLALGRLGMTDQVLASGEFFREELADHVEGGGATAPLIASSSFVTHEPSGRRAGSVIVYGVDERFWRFHGVQPPAGPAISPALAAELGAQSGDTVLVRLQRPSEIPIESLFGRKEEIGRTLRLTVSDVLPRERLGEFALRPQQTELRAVFAPLSRVQRDLGVPDRVNTILMAGASDEARGHQGRTGQHRSLHGVSPIKVVSADREDNPEAGPAGSLCPSGRGRSTEISIRFMPTDAKKPALTSGLSDFSLCKAVLKDPDKPET